MNSMIRPLVLSATAILLAACSEGGQSSAASSEVVAAQPQGEITCEERLATSPRKWSSTRLKAVGNATFAPFSFQNPGSNDVVGIDADILQRVAEIMGIQHSLEKADWGQGCCLFGAETTPRAPTSAAESALWFGLTNHRFDLAASSIAMKPDRIQVFPVSTPVYSAPFFGFVAKTSSTQSFDLTFGTGLAGVTVAIQPGTTFETYVKLRYPLATRVPIAAQNDAGGALGAGTVSLLLVQLGQAGVAEKLATNEFKIVKTDSEADGLIDRRDPQGYVNVWGRGTMWVHRLDQDPDFIKTVDCALEKVVQDEAFFQQLAAKFPTAHLRTPLPALASLPMPQ